jgi:hypothetical protein
MSGNSFALAGVLSVVLSFPAMAQPSAGAAGSADAKAQAEAPKPKTDADRVVCKKITYTGSRLGGEKICRSVRQWSESQRAAQDATAQVQRNASVVE